MNESTPHAILSKETLEAMASKVSDPLAGVILAGLCSLAVGDRPHVPLSPDQAESMEIAGLGHLIRKGA